MAENYTHCGTGKVLNNRSRRRTSCATLLNNCRLTRITRCRNVGQVTLAPIDILDDDVLLGIFYFYVGEDKDAFEVTMAWQSLVHVCRRWRNVVFGSPRHLNLRLLCTTETPARDMLDVWPPLSLIIHGSGYHATKGVDNVIAVLERSIRVCKIDLDITSWQLGTVLPAMEVPFPELTYLRLVSYDVATPAAPDSFLACSAPRLQELWLDRVLFPGLPRLLWSATRLVTLCLRGIPHLEYISPDLMVASLSASASLERLMLQYLYFEPHRDEERRHPPPRTRTVLPALTHFEFEGVDEYLEDLVSRIDVPRLNHLDVTFLGDIVFDIPFMVEFTRRTPTFDALDEAHVIFCNTAVQLKLPSWTSGNDGQLDVEIPRASLHAQLSSVVQICTSFLPPISSVASLYIYQTEKRCEDDVENTQWLELLRSFTTMKNLYLCKRSAPRISTVLQEVVTTGRMLEVLPTLQNIFLQDFPPSGLVQEGVGLFATARRIFCHYWDIDWN